MVKKMEFSSIMMSGMEKYGKQKLMKTTYYTVSLKLFQVLVNQATIIMGKRKVFLNYIKTIN